MADATTWLPAIVALASGGGIAWIFRIHKENESTAVETAENALLLMQALNDRLLKNLDRSEASIDRLEKENEILLAELRDCTKGCHELKLELEKQNHRGT